MSYENCREHRNIVFDRFVRVKLHRNVGASGPGVRIEQFFSTKTTEKHYAPPHSVHIHIVRSCHKRSQTQHGVAAIRIMI
jgi:hypothetical protein